MTEKNNPASKILPKNKKKTFSPTKKSYRKINLWTVFFYDSSHFHDKHKKTKTGKLKFHLLLAKKNNNFQLSFKRLKTPNFPLNRKKKKTNTMAAISLTENSTLKSENKNLFKNIKKILWEIVTF